MSRRTALTHFFSSRFPFCVDGMFYALRSNVLTTDLLWQIMAHGVVRIEIEIAVYVGWLSVDIHFRLRTPPCGDSV